MRVPEETFLRRLRSHPSDPGIGRFSLKFYGSIRIIVETSLPSRLNKKCKEGKEAIEYISSPIFYPSWWFRTCQLLPKGSCHLWASFVVNERWRQLARGCRNAGSTHLPGSYFLISFHLSSGHYLLEIHQGLAKSIP